jgi:hypothetical protein
MVVILQVMSPSCRTIRFYHRKLMVVTQSPPKPRKVHKVSIDPNLSPNSKTIKRAQYHSVQVVAYNELLSMRAASGGKIVKGDTKKIVDKYQAKCHNVERWHIEHQVNLAQVGRELQICGNNKSTPKLTVVVDDDHANKEELSLVTHSGSSDTSSDDGVSKDNIDDTGLLNELKLTPVKMEMLVDDSEDHDDTLSISDNGTTNETSTASKSFGGHKKGSTKKFLVE